MEENTTRTLTYVPMPADTRNALRRRARHRDQEFWDKMLEAKLPSVSELLQGQQLASEDTERYFSLEQTTSALNDYLAARRARGVPQKGLPVSSLWRY